MQQPPISIPSPVRVSPSDPFGSNVQTQSPETSQAATSIPAAFRALPLLSSDLPNTIVIVSHSFVRPNDRGKEVLSFIVFVNPGHGKEGWKVEKMYSDVLNLDQRVRNSVGKGVGKKIANLPEGKLWKDHAPAKVDQRKVSINQCCCNPHADAIF
jgi:RalA-binding protein 1